MKLIIYELDGRWFIISEGLHWVSFDNRSAALGYALSRQATDPSIEVILRDEYPDPVQYEATA